MKDFFNREIEIGNMIVYPVRRGSSLWMNFGAVIDVTDKKIKAVVAQSEKTWKAGKLVEEKWITREATLTVSNNIVIMEGSIFEIPRTDENPEICEIINYLVENDL